MARAKNTDRAEARRRYREQQRATEAGEQPTSLMDVQPAAPPPSSSGSIFGSIRMPDVRADIRALPGMIASNRKLWLPFLLLIVSFVLAVALTKELLPDSIGSIAALYVQLTLPPTSLFVFFLGGFLAPRGSWLVGAVLGLFDGVLWSLLFVISPKAEIDGSAGSPTTAGGNPTDYLSVIALAVGIGILAGGFAAWYRAFLRQSQERAAANRAARERAAKEKAKEQERAAREAQRQAAAEARSAGKGDAKKG